MNLLGVSMEKYGIPPGDVVGTRVFTAGIMGIGEMLKNQSSVQYILQQNSGSYDPRMIQDIGDMTQRMLIQRFVDAYKIPILLKLISFLGSNQLITGVNKSYIMDMALGKEQSIRFRVGSDIDRDCSVISNDPYGFVEANFNSRTLQVEIKYDTIMVSKILREAGAGTEEPITVEELSAMVFCHELMHVASTELPIFNTLNDKIIEFGLRDSIDKVPEEQFYAQRYYQYRSGYNYSFLDDEDMNCVAINEAITEVMAAEFYNSLIGQPGLEGLKNPYKIVYTRNVDRFYRALEVLSGGDEDKKEEAMGRIRQGYFHGGEGAYETLRDIIEPMAQYFEDIDDQKPEIII